MDKYIIIRDRNIYLNNIEEDKYYDVLLDKPSIEIVFPGPKYIKRGKPFNDTIEYYSEILTHLDKKVIPMLYQGNFLFEIDITFIVRDRKLKEILGE